MRSANVNLAVADLSQGVAAAIESEPSHDGTGTDEDRLFRILKPVAGIAVAATVALVAIVSLQAPEVDVDGMDGTPPVVQGTTAGNVIAVPASYSLGNNNDRLTNYLIQHSEYSAPMGSRNVLLEIIGNDEIVAEETAKKTARNTETATDGDEKAEE
jgi:negative regulator of sigma E activity